MLIELRISFFLKKISIEDREPDLSIHIFYINAIKVYYLTCFFL